MERTASAYSFASRGFSRDDGNIRTLLPRGKASRGGRAGFLSPLLRKIQQIPVKYAAKYALIKGADTAGKADDTRERDIAAEAEAILSEEGNRIFRLAYSMLRSRQDAEDIVQDTLIRFMEAAPRFENEGHRKAWLLTAAGNLCRSRRRYLLRRETDELSELLAGEKEEDLSFLWEAVKSLPPDDAAVLHLFYYEDLPTDRIADILGMKPASVRSRLTRARQKLRSVLKEEYDFE